MISIMSRIHILGFVRDTQEDETQSRTRYVCTYNIADDDDDDVKDDVRYTAKSHAYRMSTRMLPYIGK